LIRGCQISELKRRFAEDALGEPFEPGFVLGCGAQAVGVQAVVEEAGFEQFFEAAKFGADRAGQESGEADLDQCLIRVLRLFYERLDPGEVGLPGDFLFEGEPGEAPCSKGVMVGGAPGSVISTRSTLPLSRSPNLVVSWVPE